jgi:hypothetical protein
MISNDATCISQINPALPLQKQYSKRRLFEIKLELNLSKKKD